MCFKNLRIEGSLDTATVLFYENSEMECCFHYCKLRTQPNDRHK